MKTKIFKWALMWLVLFTSCNSNKMYTQEEVNKLVANAYSVAYNKGFDIGFEKTKQFVNVTAYKKLEDLVNSKDINSDKFFKEAYELGVINGMDKLYKSSLDDGWEEYQSQIKEILEFGHITDFIPSKYPESRIGLKYKNMKLVLTRFPNEGCGCDGYFGSLKLDDNDINSMIPIHHNFLNRQLSYENILLFNKRRLEYHYQTKK